MKLLKGVTVYIILFLLCIVAPFNIHAESIDSHIRGRNYSFKLNQSEKINTNNIYVNSGIFHITFELDDNYLGYILPNYTVTYRNYYYGASSPYWGTSSAGFNRRVFINGSSFSFDVPITWYSNGAFATNSGSDPFEYDSYTITSSDVTKTSDINSLEQIVDILTDLYNSQDQVEGLLSNQLTQLQQVVSNTNLSNTYLNQLTQIKQYRMPIESFTAVSKFMGYTIDSWSSYSYYDYPIFNIKSGFVLRSKWGDGTDNYNQNLILGVSGNVFDLNSFNNVFSYTNATIKSFSEIYRNDYGGTTFSFFKINFNVTSSGYANFTFKTDKKVIPIWLDYYRNKFISTDFALEWGLSNSVIENLNIIANGTNQSNQQASDLSSETDSMQQQMNNFTATEDSYNDQMNNSINAIDFTSPVSQNAGILPAANFVINIFNGLIQNNAFSVLILIVCVLIIGKKVIGK